MRVFATLKQQVLWLLAASVISMPLFSCSGTRLADLGVKDGHLLPCPASPNCVSSDAPDTAHSVAPFRLIVPPTDGWRAVQAAIDGLPRTKMISVTDDYLHVECSSAVFGFVDDLELLGTLSVFRWIESRIPTQLYSQFVVRFVRDKAMPEAQMRRLLTDYGFTVANLNYRLDVEAGFLEYQMIIRTTQADNASQLTQALNAIDAVKEYRVSPTGD